MSSILTTDKLVKTIKRRGFVPNSQETMTDEDLLQIATEEMNFAIVPMLMRAQEEHLVYTFDVDFELNKSKYEIPDRAHGNKLRDVSLIDNNGNVYEMFRYSLDEVSDFNRNGNRSNTRGFYIENNQVVLLGELQSNYKSLRFYIYLRPNALVPFDQGSVILSKVNQFETDNINPFSQNILSISTGTDSILDLVSTSGLSNNDYITITSSNSTPSLDGNWQVQVLNSTQVKIQNTNVTVAGNSGVSTKIIECSVFTLNKVPKKYSADLLYDFTGGKAPNKILYWNIPINSLNFNTKVVSFPKTLISDVSVNDFLSIAEESIVPNVPVELHPVLAQRVVVAYMEAMGDEQGKQSAERKLKDMETNVMTLLDNRVEAANVKIKNRHGVLQQTSRSRRRIIR